MPLLLVLDASTGISYILNIPSTGLNIDETEEYIEQTLDININDCQWMLTNKIIDKRVVKPPQNLMKP